MTRLTEPDVRSLAAALPVLDASLRETTGLTLRDVAMRSIPGDPACVPLYGSRIAAVPISAGEGFIPGFCECVVAILEHLGCDAWVTEHPDVRGIQDAVDDGARVLFLADDHRFVALNVRCGDCVDDDPATADGYVTLLEGAAGSLAGVPVLVLGLGPVGLAASRRLLKCGADVYVVEPDEMRLSAATGAQLPLRPVTLRDGLQRCRLVLDACPAADLIDADQVGPDSIAAVPGIPSAFTKEARAKLGGRHIHEPLAVGVAVMAARALA